MKGRDFIITGLQSWDIPIGSNAIDIAKEIATTNRVLYVNTPLDQMTIFRNKIKPEEQRRLRVINKQEKPLRQISDSLWVVDLPFSVWSVNGLPDGPLFDFFNRLNNRKIFRYVAAIAKELGFREVIHFMDNDIYRSFYSKEYLKPRFSVYYRRDNLQPYPYWKKHVRRLEPLMIAKSDLVVCNSPQYADFSRPFNSRSFDIGQGVDLSAYNPDLKYDLPEMFNTIPEPRLGYIGDINSLRLDPDLLFELAKSRPQYSFVIIGSEDKVFKEHALHSLPNVYFPGSIAKNSVAQHMAAFQVCLNPQLLNEITNGNYPRKVDEYLAMGKPVIATRTATMEIFKDHTYLCKNLQEYQEASDKALLEDNETLKAARISFAQSHSWANNVANIYQYIQKFIQ
ncbi:MAG TPA: glycosyltransferase family 1 protein [Prolixibacteraceae bacterium]|nr:glycosyltransferase family 1 protein [Prolixibacteraceae bacterium]